MANYQFIYTEITLFKLTNLTEKILHVSFYYISTLFLDKHEIDSIINIIPRYRRLMQVAFILCMRGRKEHLVQGITYPSEQLVIFILLHSRRYLHLLKGQFAVAGMPGGAHYRVYNRIMSIKTPFLTAS